MELRKPFHTSQRCQPCPQNQFQGILGVWHNLHPYCGTSTTAALFFYYCYFISCYHEMSLLFQSKKGTTDKIWWCFILYLNYKLLSNIWGSDLIMDGGICILK